MLESNSMICYFKAMADFKLSYEEFRWVTEDGEGYALGELNRLRPVVDLLQGRLYAVTQLGSVVLMHDYGPQRRSSARDAALFFWGDPLSWNTLDEHVVNCVCQQCTDPVSDLASSWTLTILENGLIKASHPDKGRGLLGEHTIYESPYLDPDSEVVTRANEVATFALMVSNFGEPVSMVDGSIGVPYSQLYRAQ